ncbi:MAG TPA: hypothetical protein VF516_23095 [Kofleriaceae bacterium]
MLHGDAPARRVVRAPAQDDNLLLLTGGIPQTVNLSVVAGVPMFSLPGSTQLYTGIKWEPNGYGLMITFAFQQPSGSSGPFISELAPITPSLWISDTFPEDSESNQMCCVPPTLGEYHFNVVLDDGTLALGDGTMVVDPRIVVTPIT